VNCATAEQFLRALRIRSAILVQRGITTDKREAIRLASIALAAELEREHQQAQQRLTEARVEAIDRLTEETK
jgi:hypothetical protein